MKRVFVTSLLMLGCMTLPAFAQEVEPSDLNDAEIVEEVKPQESEELEAEPTVEPEEPEVEPISEPEPEVLNGWQEENTKYYIDGKAVNGVQTIDKDVYYFENETLNPYTGFVKNTDNRWIFVRDGKSDWTFTGVAKSKENGKWYHADKGVLNWNFTGISKSVENGKWYFSRKGALDWSFTGVAKSVENGKWYHARKGALDWNFTGVSKSVENGRWYHSKNGRLDWSFTGISKSIENGKWYFSRKGALDWNFTGVAKSIQNGKWYYARKGALDWKYTGLGKSVENGKLYYCKNGSLDWKYTNVWQQGNNIYFVKKGAVRYGSFTENRISYRANTKTGIIESAIHDGATKFYLNQKDGRWSAITLGGTIGSNGCVPTSLAMVYNIIKYSHAYTPYSVAINLYRASFFNGKEGSGSGGNGIVYSNRTNGFSYKQIGYNYQTLKNELLKGRMVALALQGSPFMPYGGSHEVVLYGYDSRNNKVYMMDPYFTSNNQTYDLNYVFNHFSKESMDSRNGGPAFSIWK